MAEGGRGDTDSLGILKTTANQDVKMRLGVKNLVLSSFQRNKASLFLIIFSVSH